MSTQSTGREDAPRCTGRDPPLPLLRAWGAGHACRLFAGRPDARAELARRFSTEVALSGVVVRVRRERWSAAIGIEIAAFALKGWRCGWWRCAPAPAVAAPPGCCLHAEPGWTACAPPVFAVRFTMGVRWI